jgi:hypothetical protein
VGQSAMEARVTQTKVNESEGSGYSSLADLIGLAKPVWSLVRPPPVAQHSFALEPAFRVIFAPAKVGQRPLESLRVCLIYVEQWLAMKADVL